MLLYRCYFLSADNRISDVVTFEGAHDQAALEHARRLFASQDIYHGFELWETDRLIHARLPPTRPAQ